MSYCRAVNLGFQCQHRRVDIGRAVHAHSLISVPLSIPMLVFNTLPTKC